MSESTPTTNNTIKDVYDRIAQERDDGGCCPGDDGGEKSGFQPSYEDVEGHVPEADLGLGCGIPLDENTLDGGETVLDLGSGAGNDCFVARRDVGPEGKVIGVDFSEEMPRKPAGTPTISATTTSNSGMEPSATCPWATKASTWSSRTVYSTSSPTKSRRSGRSSGSSNRAASFRCPT